MPEFKFVAAKTEPEPGNCVRYFLPETRHIVAYRINKTTGKSEAYDRAIDVVAAVLIGVDGDGKATLKVPRKSKGLDVVTGVYRGDKPGQWLPEGLST